MPGGFGGRERLSLFSNSPIGTSASVDEKLSDTSEENLEVWGNLRWVRSGHARGLASQTGNLETFVFMQETS